MTNPFKKNKKAVTTTPPKGNLRPMHFKPVRTGLPVHGLAGYALLFVCASILYANYRVYFGVEEMIPRLMLIPSTLAVAVFLIFKAGK